MASRRKLSNDLQNEGEEGVGIHLGVSLIIHEDAAIEYGMAMRMNR